MVGISHYAVRRAISEWLPTGSTALWPTEMLSSRRIPYEKEGQNPETLMLDKDAGLCPQLLGNEETFIRESIHKLEGWGASAIDINMGCPVQQALKHNYGVALMGDADYAARVTEYAVKSTKWPVSVKLRAGLQNDSEFLVGFAKGLENAGASWITLHPRTAEQKRRGRADWNQIRLLKEQLKIPVVGNGDLQCQEDIDEVFSETNCDRVMIGRALLAKPWLVSGVRPEDPGAAYGQFLNRVLELSREHYPLEKGLRKIRFLVYHSAVWFEFGHFLYAQCKGAHTYEALADVFEKFFSQSQRMMERTERRH